jgi:hypothetical protein
LLRVLLDDLQLLGRRLLRYIDQDRRIGSTLFTSSFCLLLVVLISAKLHTRAIPPGCAALAEAGSLTTPASHIGFLKGLTSGLCGSGTAGGIVADEVVGVASSSMGDGLMGGSEVSIVGRVVATLVVRCWKVVGCVELAIGCSFVGAAMLGSVCSKSRCGRDVWRWFVNAASSGQLTEVVGSSRKWGEVGRGKLEARNTIVCKLRSLCRNAPWRQ